MVQGQIDEAKIAQVMEIGFTRQQAEEALKKVNGNPEAAINMLIDQGGPPAQPDDDMQKAGKF